MDIKRQNLIFAGLKKRGGRTAGTIIIVSILSFSLLIGTLLLISLRGGISSLEERLGADIMVVPLGYESGAEGILIKGEPSYFYFGKNALDELSGVEGVGRISSQFYLTSSNQGCCDIPVQFIGIDESTDFSVLPWIKTSFSGEKEYMSDGLLVVGSDIDVPADKKLRFFDSYYTVSAQLEETGTGLDQAVFSNMNTTKKLFGDAKAKGFNFTSNINPDDYLSNIMIKVEDGYSVETVSHNIRSKYDGYQIIETRNMTNSIENSLKGFIIVLYILLSILTVLTIIILLLLFRLQVIEDMKIYTVMKTVGASSSQIRRLVLSGAAVTGITGAFLGVVIASLIVYPFNDFYGTVVSIPYLLPSAGKCILLTLAVFIVAALTGPLSAFVSSINLSRSEVWELQGKI